MTAVKRTGTHTVPTQLAALAAGVSEATIRQWATRGKLTRYGRPGRREYSLQELTELLERNAEQPPGKRRQNQLSPTVGRPAPSASMSSPAASPAPRP